MVVAVAVGAGVRRSWPYGEVRTKFSWHSKDCRWGTFLKRKEEEKEEGKKRRKETREEKKRRSGEKKQP